MSQKSPFRICWHAARLPHHRLHVEVAGRTLSGFLLRSISTDKTTARDVLLLTDPEKIISSLPEAMTAGYMAFSREVHQLSQSWRFHGVPTLKKITRLYAKGELFSKTNLVTVVNHYGAVPAYVLDTVDEIKVALLSDAFVRNFSAHSMTEPEVIELLCSLDDSLPTQFLAYYEQIAYYLNAIFFGSDDRHALNFCLRARELVVGSLRGKRDLLLNCPPKFAGARQLANVVARKYKAEILVSKAVDALTHLIVNYTYSFFCIKHRAGDYLTILEDLPAGEAGFEDDTVALLRRCGNYILSPEADQLFLEELVTRTQPMDAWLRTFAETSALVAEIIRSTRRESLDSPRIFLTHHFQVEQAEVFHDNLVALISEMATAAKLIRGRHIDSDLRWSLLARIWISDYHLFFLPARWEKYDGTKKNLKARGNWVNLELFYGQRLKRELRCILAQPGNEEELQGFRQHIEHYTEENEIQQIDPNEWQKFIPAAKQQLSQILQSRHHLSCDPSNLNEAFRQRLKSEVLDPAARRLVISLFRAWSTFFPPAKWSIVQAMLLQAHDRDTTFHLLPLAKYISTQSQSENPERFLWAQAIPTLEKLERRVADDLRDITQFEFVLDTGAFAPLRVISKRPLSVMLRAKSLYGLLCRKFLVAADRAQLEQIFRQLTQIRNG